MESIQKGWSPYLLLGDKAASLPTLWQPIEMILDHWYDSQLLLDLNRLLRISFFNQMYHIWYVKQK